MEDTDSKDSYHINSVLDIGKILQHMDLDELDYVKKVCDMLMARIILVHKDK